MDFIAGKKGRRHTGMLIRRALAAAAATLRSGSAAFPNSDIILVRKQTIPLRSLCVAPLSWFIPESKNDFEISVLQNFGLPIFNWHLICSLYGSNTVWYSETQRGRFLP